MLGYRGREFRDKDQIQVSGPGRDQGRGGVLGLSTRSDRVLESVFEIGIRVGIRVSSPRSMSVSGF